MKIESAFLDISRLDALASRNTAVHRLDPRAKVLTTLIFIVTVISFRHYEISGLIPFFIFPLVMMSLGNIPGVWLMKKTALVLPFAFFIGIFNPLFDTEILMHIGPVPISGGWISFISILIRFILTVSAALLLIATTGFSGICMALEKMGVPQIFAVQLLFLYRYLFVLTDEASRMARARALRSFDGRGMGIKVFGYLIGHLLLRTLDRARRIHHAMICRGFDGEIRLIRQYRLRMTEAGFVFGFSGLFILMRVYNLSVLYGNLLTKLFN